METHKAKGICQRNPLRGRELASSRLLYPVRPAPRLSWAGGVMGNCASANVLPSRATQSADYAASASGCCRACTRAEARGPFRDSAPQCQKAFGPSRCATLPSLLMKSLALVCSKTLPQCCAVTFGLASVAAALLQLAPRPVGFVGATRTGLSGLPDLVADVRSGTSMAGSLTLRP
jgi:hypothetical protein